MKFEIPARLAAAAAASMLLLSGCGWMRHNTGYENSPETRPLELPPDMDSPAVDDSMAIPAGGSAYASKVQDAAYVQLFDGVEQAWAKLGGALDGMDGVKVKDRSKLLAVYTVEFRGEEFLLRVRAEGQGSRISAVSQDGSALNGGTPRALIEALRSKFGG